MDSLASFLEPIELPLTQLFLDPNNPRFVGSDWAYIPDATAITEAAQEAASTRLIAHHDVKKLQLIIEAGDPQKLWPVERLHDSLGVKHGECRYGSEVTVQPERAS